MLREIVEANILKYGDWKQASDDINSEVDKLSDILQKFPSGSMGLTPDEVRNSKEYKSAKKNFDNAFKKLQDFNKNSSKEFKRQKSKEHRANRGNRGK